MKTLACIGQVKFALIEEAYHLFENKLNGVIKVAVEPQIKA